MQFGQYPRLVQRGKLLVHEGCQRSAAGVLAPRPAEVLLGTERRQDELERIRPRAHELEQVRQTVADRPDSSRPQIGIGFVEVDVRLDPVDSLACARKLLGERLQGLQLRRAGLRADRVAGNVLGRLDRSISLAFDQRHGRVGNRQTQRVLLVALPGDGHRGDNIVELGRRQPGKNALPGKIQPGQLDPRQRLHDVLHDVRRVADDLAFLHELERWEPCLGSHDEFPPFLDLGQKVRFGRTAGEEEAGCDDNREHDRPRSLEQGQHLGPPFLTRCVENTVSARGVAVTSGCELSLKINTRIEVRTQENRPSLPVTSSAVGEGSWASTRMTPPRGSSSLTGVKGFRYTPGHTIGGRPLPIGRLPFRHISRQP